MRPLLAKNPDSTRCFVDVPWREIRGPNWSQCQRKWKVEVEGIRYCTQHDPKNVKAREDASRAKYDKEWDKQRLGWRSRAACADVPSPMLKPGIVRKLIDFAYEMDNQELVAELEREED